MTDTQTMKAMGLLQKPKVGNIPNEIKELTVSIPKINSTEVLVKIVSSTIHVDDIAQAQGTAVGKFLGPKEVSKEKPYIMGTNFSGVIEAIGNQVSQFNIGDEVIGNYELQFSMEADFDFLGGGLIIRFSSPSVAYAADSSCTQVLVSASATDTSGYFVSRIYRDSDGEAPWNVLGGDSIGGFRVDATGSPTVTAPATPIPTLSTFGIAIMMMGLLLLAGRRLMGSTKKQ